MKEQYFVSGIGTNIGKTIASAVLCEYLQAAYYKPIQSGNLEQPESEIVASLVEGLRVFPTTVLLKEALSPHLAAEKENIQLSLDDFSLPSYNDALIVEGAGGILVPLNQTHTMADLMEHFQLPIILVASHYLGSINHTLLSIAYLKSRKMPLKGIIFNGIENPDSERIILKQSAVRHLGNIPYMENLNPDSIKSAAQNLHF